MTDYVIGVDIGTGSTKSLAFNLEGKLISSAQVHYPTLHPAPGHCEQSPEIVWQAFVKSVGRITRELPTPRAIILSAAMHSIVPVDAKGTALSNMIVWADNRSGAIAKRIKASSSGEMIYEQTGTPIHAMSPLCKLVWMKENQNALFRSAAKFISIKEYIWFRLFHSFQIDHSLASATGLMDIENLSWSENAMDIASVSDQQLSALVSTDFSRTDVVADIATLLGVAHDTRIIIGASDGCLANLGSFATQPGVAALTIGTSGAVRVASTKPVHHFGSMIFNYRLDKETFICGGPSNNGGAALKWFIEKFLARTLETADDYDTVLKNISDSTPGADGLIFLPYLFGERAPVWNSDASAAFFGIRGRHTQADFTRAVVEGISMAVYDIADHITLAGLPIDRVHVSGGFVRSSAWLQILADIFNKPIGLVYADDASATGAAYLGLKTIGALDNYVKLRPDIIKEFSPQPDFTERYRHQLQRYRAIYKNLQPLMVP